MSEKSHVVASVEPCDCGRVPDGVEKFDRVKHCHRCTMRSRGRHSVTVKMPKGSSQPPSTVGLARQMPAMASAILAPPCPHRGTEVVRQAPCIAPCGNKGKVIELFRCAHFGDDCFTGVYHPAEGRACMRCPVPNTDRHASRGVDSTTPTTGRLEWVSNAALARDAVRLAGLVPHDAAGIVGIPRSGLLAATLIATHLHLPLYELTEEGALNRLGSGSRGRNWGWPAGATGPLVVVDDTTYSGAALGRAKEAVRRLGLPSVLFAVVYPRPGVEQPDLFCRHLPSPHLLEWNVANNAIIRGNPLAPEYQAGIAFDLDGVIVHDAESGGPMGTPYLLPRTVPVPLICTGRKESSRPETEALLARYGAKYNRLVMLPDDVEMTTESVAAHKARYYLESGCGFFLESCPAQAALIFSLSSRPVVCPRADKVFQ